MKCILMNKNTEVLVAEYNNISKFFDEIIDIKNIDYAPYVLKKIYLEKSEDLRVTAVRETYEETGIKLNPLDIELIDTLSGESRKNSYPNGDIVYNNTSLYLANVTENDIKELKGDSETKRLQFFNIDSIPENIMDIDLINAYKNYNKKNYRLK